MGLLLVILRLHCVVKNPSALGLQDRHFHVLQQASDVVDNGVGLPRSLVLGLGSCRVGQSVHVLPCPHHLSCVVLEGAGPVLLPSKYNIFEKY